MSLPAPAVWRGGGLVCVVGRSEGMALGHWHGAFPAARIPRCPGQDAWRRQLRCLCSQLARPISASVIAPFCQTPATGLFFPVGDRR